MPSTIWRNSLSQFYSPNKRHKKFDSAGPLKLLKPSDKERTKMKSYRHTACWALFLLVALFATPSKGQQVPLFDVPLTETNATVRTNFCDIHRKIERGETLLRHALKDMNLRVGLFRYQLDKETGAIAEVDPPIGIKMLDEIARRGQFKWRDSFGVVDSPGENQTWGEVLDWSVDTYDLNGDWFLRTTDRLADGILFPEKWYDGSLIMVRKQAEADDSFSWRAFMKPFSTGVWVLIVITTVISGLVYYLNEYIGCDGDTSKMEVNMQESVFQSFLNATGQYIFDPREPGNRAIAVSTCLLFLVVLASYTANLASFLVIRNTPDLVINDIQDVVKNDLRVCVWRSTTSETFMRDRYDTARLVQKDSLLDSYLGLDNDDCDVVLTTIGTWETRKGDIVYNKDCRKEWVGRVVQHNDAGFSLRDSVELCSSMLRDAISLHLLEMKRDKTYDTIWNTYRAKSVTNNCEDIENSEDNGFDSIQLTVMNVGGIFIVHGVILVIGIAFTLFSKNGRRTRKAKLARAVDKDQNLNVQPNRHSTTVKGATMKLDSSAMSDVEDSDHDLQLSEEDNPSSKEMKYIAAMEQQMQFMASMQQQMADIQAQLAQLRKERSESE